MEKKITVKKTKRQIELEHPFIKPNDCPGAIIDWVKQRDEKRDEDLRKRDENLVKLIADTIDTLFEKHFRKYVSMIFNNRVYIIVTGLVLGILWGVVMYHLYLK